MSSSVNPHAPIAIDGKEFGEGYHVAAALALDPELEVVVIGKDKFSALPFLSLFAKGRVRKVSSWPANTRNVAESTQIYCSRWCPGAIASSVSRALQTAEPHSNAVNAFLHEREIQSEPYPAALLWIRNMVTSGRNSTEKSICQLLNLFRKRGWHPILIGDSLAGWAPAPGNLINFHRDNAFKGPDLMIRHLAMFRALIDNYGVRVIVGIKSGAIDGPGLFMRLPTISLTTSYAKTSWERVKKIEERIANFHVIQLANYRDRFHQHSAEELDRISEHLDRIALSPAAVLRTPTN